MPVGIAQSVYRPPERLRRGRPGPHNRDQKLARILLVLAFAIMFLVIRYPDEIWPWTWRILLLFFLALAVVGDLMIILAFCWALWVEPKQNVAALERMLEAAERNKPRCRAFEKAGWGDHATQVPSHPEGRSTRPAKCA